MDSLRCAALATDARRWAAPTSHLAFIEALSLFCSFPGLSERLARFVHTSGVPLSSLASAAARHDSLPTSIPPPDLSRLCPRGATSSVSPLPFPTSHLTRGVPTRSGVRLHVARRTGSSTLRAPLKPFAFISHEDEHQLRIAAPNTSRVHLLPSPSLALPGPSGSPPNPGVQRTRFARR